MHTTSGHQTCWSELLVKWFLMPNCSWTRSNQLFWLDFYANSVKFFTAFRRVDRIYGTYAIFSVGSRTISYADAIIWLIKLNTNVWIWYTIILSTIMPLRIWLNIQLKTDQASVTKNARNIWFKHMDDVFLSGTSNQPEILMQNCAMHNNLSLTV